MPQIEVTFDIDANGILHVSRQGSRHRQGAENLHHRLLRPRSKDEVEKHAEGSRTARRGGQKAKEAVEIRNNADNLAYQCEKQLKDLGDKVPADKKTEIEAAIANVREALKGNDTDAIKTAYTICRTSSRPRAKNSTSRPPRSAGAGAAAPVPDRSLTASRRPAARRSSDGDVVDAEFEVVDEDKKK